MATHTAGLPLLLKKLGGLIALILGFLLVASGYRYGSAEFTSVGVALLVLGVVLIAFMIARRNRSI